MQATGFHLFDTALGQCGLAWTGQAGGRSLSLGEQIVAVALPEEDTAKMVDYLRSFGGERDDPPPAAVDAEGAIRSLLVGEDIDMTSISVAMNDLPEFDREVYAVTRSIPRGRTLTYGEVAARIGRPHGAQAVGGALGRNPIPIIVPCHRVLGAGAEVGGFSAPGGRATKAKILAIEGIAGFDEPTLF